MPVKIVVPILVVVSFITVAALQCGTVTDDTPATPLLSTPHPTPSAETVQALAVQITNRSKKICNLNHTWEPLSKWIHGTITSNGNTDGLVEMFALEHSDLLFIDEFERTVYCAIAEDVEVSLRAGIMDDYEAGTLYLPPGQ